MPGGEEEGHSAEAMALSPEAHHCPLKHATGAVQAGEVRAGMERKPSSSREAQREKPRGLGHLLDVGGGGHEKAQPSGSC